MTHHRVIWDGKRMVPTRYYLTLGVRAKGTDHFLLGPIDVQAADEGSISRLTPN